MKKISVCYILTYYSPKYVRTEVLVQALSRIEQIELYQARNTVTGFLRYAQTLWKLFVVRVSHNPQFYILGFRGYEFFWVVRLLTLGKTLIYDHMMSPYDSLLNEKAAIRKGSLFDKLIYLYEKSILSASDLVLTDTDIHKQYFCDLFALPTEKIETIPVGTDENLFRVKEGASVHRSKENFEVLYYGSFLPLHGMDVILQAAFLLRDEPIHFTLIGGNRLDISDFHRVVKNLNLQKVTHLNWVEFEELPSFILNADIGLGGPFGGTGQAQRVITGKTFQFLSMAKPVIIGKTKGDGRWFVSKENCLIVPQNDENALADTILWGFEHQSELLEIGQRGYELFRSRYSTEHISEKLKEIIDI
jgi:glycosyltransferase involved in cell wall biosynthesis